MSHAAHKHIQTDAEAASKHSFMLHYIPAVRETFALYVSAFGLQVM